MPNLLHLSIVFTGVASSVSVLSAVFVWYRRRHMKKKGSLKIMGEDGSVVEIGDLDKSEVQELVGRFRDRVQSFSK
jgi:hypothetical protein